MSRGYLLNSRHATPERGQPGGGRGAGNGPMLEMFAKYPKVDGMDGTEYRFGALVGYRERERYIVTYCSFTHNVDVRRFSKKFILFTNFLDQITFCVELRHA